MTITKIELTDFRLFEHFNAELGPGFNVIYGDNGSGKSSILEAIFYIARGRSFRTANSNRMLRDDADRLVVYLQTQRGQFGDFSLAIERTRQGKVRCKAGGDEQSSMIALSRHLPILFLDTDSHRLLASGPGHRRQLIDWGLFYGNQQQFYPVWKAYRRCLKQRNAALKLGVVDRSWDQLLIEHGQALTQMRQDYVTSLQIILQEIWSDCAGQNNCGQLTLQYSPGWAANQTFQEALTVYAQRDLALGYTQSGPHRADLKINVNARPAHHYLSQGQQKMLTYVLALAQGRHFRSVTGQGCIYLFDDFCAELDLKRRRTLVAAIAHQQSQVLLTGILHRDINALVAKESVCKISLNRKAASR